MSDTGEQGTDARPTGDRVRDKRQRRRAERRKQVIGQPKAPRVKAGRGRLRKQPPVVEPTEREREASRRWLT